MPVQGRAHTEFGAFDAKTKLSEILRRVEPGERFTITRNGPAIADVVPSHANVKPARQKAIQDLMNFPASRESAATRYWSGFAREESKPWRWN